MVLFVADDCRLPGELSDPIFTGPVVYLAALTSSLGRLEVYSYNESHGIHSQLKKHQCLTSLASRLHHNNIAWYRLSTHASQFSCIFVEINRKFMQNMDGTVYDSGIQEATVASLPAEM